MDNNENKEICTSCGGRCCKRMPGSFFPEDFPAETRRERILAGLRAGLYQLDWWEGDRREYFLRPAITGDNRMFSPTWGGQCALLTEKGCPLPFNSRPRSCRELVPGTQPGKCFTPWDNDKFEAKQAWAKDQIFQDLIKELE